MTDHTDTVIELLWDNYRHNQSILHEMAWRLKELVHENRKYSLGLGGRLAAPWEIKAAQEALDTAQDACRVSQEAIDAMQRALAADDDATARPTSDAELAQVLGGTTTETARCTAQRTFWAPSRRDGGVTAERIETTAGRPVCDAAARRYAVLYGVTVYERDGAGRTVGQYCPSGKYLGHEVRR